MRFFLALLIVLTTGSLLHASIGDDLPTLRKKYGSALMVSGEQYIFLKNGFSVAVYLVDDKSVMEVFSREQKKDQHDDDFTSDQARELIATQIDPDKQAWREMVTRDNKTIWLRSDNKVFARFNVESKPKTLIFMSYQ